MSNQQTILHHTYDNGLTLVAEPMPWLESAAFSIALPGGYRYDPADRQGTANFVSEMIQRGAGSRNSREFLESLELLGCDFGSSVGVYNSRFRGAMQASHLHEARSIFADVLRRPHFPEDQLEDGRLVCLQEIHSLEDDLSQRTMLDLRHRFYGDPDGRHCEGSLESVAQVSLDDLKHFFEANYQPHGAIVAVAGKIDWESLKSHVGSLFDDWQPTAEVGIATTPPEFGVHHLHHDSEQTHIGLAYPSVPYAHEDYYLSRGAIGVLSGGMSSRLFDEIREKRGLCYTVYASAHSLKDRASVMCYSSTSSERAQETLDVLIEQLELLREGIREDELRRLKIQIRSGLVMQQESCRSRTGSIAGDWFHLGRVRTLDEITEIVNGLTVAAINGFLERHPPKDFSIVTLGRDPLVSSL